jgi:hypothetical protein
MSYDPFFLAKDSGRRIATDTFLNYFRGREHYKTDEKEAFYENETTGVYFSFDMGEQNQDAETGPLLPCAFNLNYFRPHVFGLEAEPELTVFVRHFDLRIYDYQSSGMGKGEYSPEGFLRGWNHGNEFGCRAVLGGKSRPPRIFMLPGVELEGYWRWNYHLAAFQAQFGERLFVPRVMFIDFDGAVRSVVVWGDGIPIALPTVDYVIVPRDELAPHRFFKREKDTVLLSWSALYNALLADFPQHSHHLNYSLLDYGSAPKHVRKYLSSQPPNAKKLRGIGASQILNAEIAAPYYPNGPENLPA